MDKLICPVCGGDDVCRNVNKFYTYCDNPECRFFILNSFWDILSAQRAALDAVHSEYFELCKRMRWIPVEERLPEKDTLDIGDEYIVLLGYPYNRPVAMSFINGDWWTGYYNCSTRWTDKITHWMPLPKPPEITPESGG